MAAGITIGHRMQTLVGRQVVIEGTFPIPVQGGQVAYAPAKGKLVEFYLNERGDLNALDLIEEGDQEPTTYLTSNLRSIHAVEDEKRIHTPKTGLVI